MAKTYDRYTAPETYTYNFTPLNTADIKVSVDNVVKTVDVDYTVNTSNTRIIFESGKEPAAGQKVIVYRDTPDTTSPYVLKDLQAGSTIRASELNSNYKHLLNIAEEAGQSLSTVIPMTMEANIHLGKDNDLIFEGSTNNDFETTLTVADPTADRTITLPNVTGNVVTTGDTNTVTSTMITDGTIVNADINAAAEIAVSKLADGSARQVLQTASNGTAVEWTSDVDLPGTLNVTGSATFDGATTIAGTLNANGVSTFGANTTVNGVLDVNGSATIDNVQINGNEVDTTSGELTIDSAGGITTIDDQLVVTGQVTANGTLVAADLSGAAVVTSGTSTSNTKVYSAKRCDELYYNIGTAEEIVSGETWVADDGKIATTAAIDARIVDLVDDVGGFVPIATELLFPNTNPDVNNGSGTIVSINSLSTNYTSNGGGLITIPNGTVGNSTVTIQGAGTTVTYNASYGMLVESTPTLNTYTFHRLVPKATEVTTVAGKATEIGRLGTADAVADMNLLATSACVEDMSHLGTAACVADMAIIADTANLVTNIATLAGNNTNVTKVAEISDDVTKVADIDSDVTAVVADAADIGACATNIGSIAAIGSDLANNFENITDYGAITGAVSATSGTSDISTLASGSNLTNIGAVAPKVTEIGRLGTADAVADMAILGTADCVADMAILATTDVVADLNTLASADVVSDLNTLGTSDIVSDMDTLADIAANITTVANNNAGVTTCANNIVKINAAETHATNAYNHMVGASAHRTQAESAAYNLSDSAASHTSWGDLSAADGSFFANESDDLLLTMSEGTSSYNYGAIT